MDISRRILFFLLISALCLTTILSPVYAAAPTPKPTPSTLSDKDAQENRDKTKELSLNIPDVTEDPNYPMTFIDPSKQGVDVTIDEKTTTKGSSPLLFPNLSIGTHDFVFKFKNKDGLVRLLTKKVLIVPKSPVFDQTLKTVIVRPSQATMKGTALPQSTVLLIVNSDKTYKISVSATGTWEFIIPEQNQGVNNIIAFTIKEGIASTPSKVFSYQYKLQNDEATQTIKTTTPTSSFIDSIQTLLLNIDSNRQNNPILFYGVIGGAILLILMILNTSMRKKAAKNRDDKTIAALFGTLQKDGGTIVDVIQATNGKKKEAEVVAEPVKTVKKMKKGSKKKPPTVPPTETTTEPVKEEKTPEKKGFNIFGLIKNKPAETTPVVEEKAKIENIVEKAKEPVAITEEVETEEPEKKILSKEEFLKQFQKSSEQDE